MAIKKPSKIHFLIIGIASVALATVGFSTWITGLLQEKVDLSITNVTVDSTKDETKYINVELSDPTLIIGEVSTTTSEDSVSPSQVNVIKIEQGESKLSIAVNKFEIAYKNDSNVKFNGVNFTVAVSDQGSINYAAKSNDPFGRTQDVSYSYLTINWPNITSENISTYFNNQIIGNYNLYTLKDVSAFKNLTFDWGALFNNEEPSKFYQTEFNKISNTETKLKMLSQMEDELKQMNVDLGGKTITVTATLDVSIN